MSQETREMELRYEETGEVRPPRAGEWFRTSRGGEERARFDFAALSLPMAAWDYRDQSGKTWDTLSDRGQDSFREYAREFLAALTVNEENHHG